MKGRKGNEAGFSLIELVVAAGLMGGLAYAATHLFQNQLKNGTQLNVIAQADTIRHNLVSALNNDAAWANTVRANPSLSCLAPLYAEAPGEASCEAGMEPVSGIQVRNAGPDGGTVIYDGGPAVNGFTATGAPCAKFLPAGSDACPFRVNLTLEILCSGADCASPQVKIRHELKYAPKDQAFRVAFNEGRYAFDFLRGQSPGGGGKDPKEICEAMFGGIFVAATQGCDLRRKTCVDMGGHWAEPSGPCNLNTAAGKPKYNGMENWPSYVFCTDVNQTPLIAELVGRNNYLQTGQAPTAYPAGVYLVSHACDGTTCEPSSFTCQTNGDCPTNVGVSCPKLALDGREVQR